MRRIFILLAVLGTLFCMSVSSAAVYAVDKQVCDGIGATSNGSGCDQPAGQKSIPAMLTTIIEVFSWLVGIVSVIMLIYGGFRYVTSGGESSAIKSAKDTMLYAIVGLVIVALAQIIVQFVLSRANAK
ncbi:MAG: hypothetical protein QG647_91 [Patescibacteria group bacterium]|nr:hypothetical protein [Patescibacteria group bacterium]